MNAKWGIGKWGEEVELYGGEARLFGADLMFGL